MWLGKSNLFFPDDKKMSTFTHLDTSDIDNIPGGYGILKDVIVTKTNSLNAKLHSDKHYIRSTGGTITLTDNVSELTLDYSGNIDTQDDQYTVTAEQTAVIRQLVVKNMNNLNSVTINEPATVNKIFVFGKFPQFVGIKDTTIQCCGHYVNKFTRGSRHNHIPAIKSIQNAIVTIYAYEKPDMLLYPAAQFVQLKQRRKCVIM
jgi:hypothetical protein